MVSKSLAIALMALFAGCKPRTYNTQVSQAAGTETEASCQAKLQDKFAFAGVAQGPEFRGQCLDTTKFRVANLIGVDQYATVAKQYGFTRALEALQRTGSAEAAQNEYILVANLRHNGTFHMAEVPVSANSVGEIFFMTERFQVGSFPQFPKPITDMLSDPELSKKIPSEEIKELQNPPYSFAHGMLHIIFKNQKENLVIAKPQFPLPSDPAALKPVNLYEIVLSVHAIGTDPNSYDPAKGMVGAYGTAHAIFSFEEMFKLTVKAQDHKIEQWKIDMKPEVLVNVMRDYLRQGTADRLNKVYNTVMINCGSELFEVFDRLTGYDPKRDEQKPYWLFGRNYPKYAKHALVARGLLPLKPGQTANPDTGKVEDAQIVDAYVGRVLQQRN